MGQISLLNGPIFSHNKRVTITMGPFQCWVLHKGHFNKLGRERSWNVRVIICKLHKCAWGWPNLRMAPAHRKYDLNGPFGIFGAFDLCVHIPLLIVTWFQFWKMVEDKLHYCWWNLECWVVYLDHLGTFFLEDCLFNNLTGRNCTGKLGSGVKKSATDIPNHGAINRLSSTRKKFLILF